MGTSIANVGLLADWASIVGLLMAIVGFYITIRTVRKTRSAAEAAEAAARDALGSISRDEAITGFAEVITMMEEIKRLHRLEAWAILPDRYSMLRKALILIQTANPHHSDNVKSDIQLAIQQVSDAEKRVEKANTTKTAQPSIGKLNEIFSDLVNRLTEIQTAILSRQME